MVKILLQYDKWFISYSTTKLKNKANFVCPHGAFSQARSHIGIHLNMAVLSLQTQTPTFCATIVTYTS